MCRLALLAGLMRKPNMIYYTGMYMLRIYVRRSICHRFASVSQIATTAATAVATTSASHQQQAARTKTPAAANGTHENERPIEWARSLRIYFNKRNEEKGEKKNQNRRGSTSRRGYIPLIGYKVRIVKGSTKGHRKL